jgi:23S rRNA pseudouridine1911/1915/1917 synthase
MTDLSKNILYEDEDMLVINKPAGLVVHPDGRTKEPSVSEWFAKAYPESQDVGEHIEKTSGEIIERAGVVHRIDRETSGILLLAKTKEGHAHLKKQFQNREIEKVYHAFVHGMLKDERGTIDLPIGKSPSDFRRWSAGRGARGEMREATTYFEVLKYDKAHNVSFVEAKPKTGRTHQIRVHFQALQRPIVGDSLYAPGKHNVLGFDRLALHARAILFENLNGEKVSIEAPYPADFQQALDNMA